MHQGSKHSAFKGAYWKAYRGDRLHNWFIARADVANFTKFDIILNGILNVHSFNSTQAEGTTATSLGNVYSSNIIRFYL